ncbi:17480_t:CDS:2 [Entrophospora sp. SA101]|nr:17480_t:CDS:2 [Entrophospora sp. SA101]
MKDIKSAIENNMIDDYLFDFKNCFAEIDYSYIDKHQISMPPYKKFLKITSSYIHQLRS